MANDTAPVPAAGSVDDPNQGDVKLVGEKLAWALLYRIRHLSLAIES